MSDRLGCLQSGIDYLKQLTQQSIQPQWQSMGSSPVTATPEGKLTFDPASSIHFHQTLTLTDHPGALVRLVVSWWAAAARLVIDGAERGVGDLFDSKTRLVLTSSLEPPLEVPLDIYLTAPTHDRGALGEAYLRFEYRQHPIDPLGFAEELSGIAVYWPALESTDLGELVCQAGALLEQVKTSLIPFSDRWFMALQHIRQTLLPLEHFFAKRRIYLMGNTHIDVAWLWELRETKEVVANTFRSVVNLQEKYPALQFHHSSALMYAWIEEFEPALWQSVQTLVQQKRWELTGGMWVEPDGNIPSGESWVRQILWGKNYFQTKFQQEVNLAWLPDTFGFHGQIPQLLTKSGFTTFVTQKLSWNDHQPFPHQVFVWEGIDGSRIRTYFSNPLGLDCDPEAIARSAWSYEKSHRMTTSLWLFGVGDHGGGPTMDMLNQALEWQQSPLFVGIETKPLATFFATLSCSDDLPVHTGELYLEFHRGTYTTKADQKRQNRSAEVLLRNVEIYCSLQSMVLAKEYPSTTLETAWKLVLQNQFHDILPGTSIPAVFEEANRDWLRVRDLLYPLWGEPAERLTLWNFCNWPRQEVIEIPLPSLGMAEEHHLLQVATGQHFPMQRTDRGLVLYTGTIPALGYATYAECAPPAMEQPLPPLMAGEFYLENSFLRLELGADTGEITQLWDRRSDRALLSRPAGFQCFADRGQYWDAWNIDPAYEEHPLPPPTLVSMELWEQGPLRSGIATTHRWGNSTLWQRFWLDAFSPFCTIETTVDWQEAGVLLKACFPLSFSADRATYEIPMGVLSRSTLPSAQWEVPAQFWADISGEGIGLSVINDCKYGYDAKPDQLRLTLLRSPQWPCPDSDRGMHTWAIRLLPHGGDWARAKVVQYAQEFNFPLVPLAPFPPLESFSFLHLDQENIVVSALKRSEDHHDWILRMYESQGVATQATVQLSLSVRSVWECDLLENKLHKIRTQNQSWKVDFLPFEIKTLRFSPSA